MRVHIGGLFGGDSSIEWDDPPRWSRTICGKCGHPYHWHECPDCADRTAPCRNDIETWYPDVATVPYDPDPLRALDDDDLVDRRLGVRDRRRRRTYGLPVLIAALVAGLAVGVLVRGVLAEGRAAGGVPVWRTATIAGEASSDPAISSVGRARTDGIPQGGVAGSNPARGVNGGASLILDPAVTAVPVSRPVVELPESPVTALERPQTGGTAGSGAEGWNVSVASFYGPGLYGGRTACGQTLTETLQGTAHRTLPCGTLVTFRNGGEPITVPVVDRGPYVAGREWDLTGATCLALGHCFTGPIEWRL